MVWWCMSAAIPIFFAILERFDAEGANFSLHFRIFVFEEKNIDPRKLPKKIFRLQEPKRAYKCRLTQLGSFRFWKREYIQRVRKIWGRGNIFSKLFLNCQNLPRFLWNFQLAESWRKLSAPQEHLKITFNWLSARPTVYTLTSSEGDASFVNSYNLI